MTDYPFRVLLPKTHDKYEVRLCTHSAHPLQFSCIAHLDCIPRMHTDGRTSSGYALLSYDDTEDGIEYAQTQKCYFCGKD